MQPTNGLVNPLLTDMYQLTMAYGYWKSGRAKEWAVFDLFFRKCPFGGEFAIFAGLEEVLRFVSDYHFTDEQIDYLKTIMPGCEEEFFNWLREVNCSRIRLYSVNEGTVVFPRIPLIRVEGPLAVAQLLETTLLNLVNFPTLIATNAARFRLAAGPDKTLMEFGLRRAQGPDGGISASRYAFIGGFDSTSNVLAGQLFGIPVRGTHAHAFVQSFTGLEDLKSRLLADKEGRPQDFVGEVLRYRKELGFTNTNEGELAAFIAYAQAFPDSFLALVDTYDTLRSGVPNFLCVALALQKMGYRPLGIRLDSGDLAYLSKETRRMFVEVGAKYGVDFSKLTIVASNDINEPILHSLKDQGHEVDVFGIGTHMATCQAQPALGCIYKLVQINDKPRIKLSNDAAKITIPGAKKAYRLIGNDGLAVADVLLEVGEAAPLPGAAVLCRHPFEETKKVLVVPSRVLTLHQCFWNGQLTFGFLSLPLIQGYARQQLALLRADHLRHLNPTPYKVSVSERLYGLTQNLRQKETPIGEIQ